MWHTGQSPGCSLPLPSQYIGQTYLDLCSISTTSDLLELSEQDVNPMVTEEISNIKTSPLSNFFILFVDLTTSHKSACKI